MAFNATLAVIGALIGLNMLKNLQGLTAFFPAWLSILGIACLIMAIVQVKKSDEKIQKSIKENWALIASTVLFLGMAIVLTLLASNAIHPLFTAVPMGLEFLFWFISARLTLKLAEKILKIAQKQEVKMNAVTSLLLFSTILTLVLINIGQIPFDHVNLPFLGGIMLAFGLVLLYMDLLDSKKDLGSSADAKDNILDIMNVNNMDNVNNVNNANNINNVNNMDNMDKHTPMKSSGLNIFKALKKLYANKNQLNAKKNGIEIFENNITTKNQSSALSYGAGNAYDSD